MKKTKQYFEKKLAENIKTDPKSFFAYTRSKTRTKDSVGPLVNCMGEVITDSIEAANLPYLTTILLQHTLTKKWVIYLIL